MPIFRSLADLQCPRRALIAGGISILVLIAGAGPAAAESASTTASARSSASSSASAASSVPGGGSSLNQARVTWGISPLSLGKTDDRSFFSYQMGPGGQYADRAVLLNYGVASVQLNVFAADLGNDSDGDVAAGLDTDTPKDAGSWIRLGGKELTATVPARTAGGPGRVIVPFTVVVPAGATPGDHGAAIMAQLSSLGKNASSQNVKLNQRIGTRVYLRVNGALHPQLTVGELSVRYHQSLNPIGGGSASVRYTVHNTGNVRLSAQQAVSVTGMFGTRSKVVTPAGVQLLFPGGSQQVTVQVRGVFPAVMEKSRVTVTPQLFQDQKMMAVPTAAASTGFTAIPWMLLSCVLGVLLFAGLLWYLRKRAKGQPQAKHGRGGGPDKPTKPSTPNRTPETIGS